MAEDFERRLRRGEERCLSHVLTKVHKYGLRAEEGIVTSVTDTWLEVSVEVFHPIYQQMAQLGILGHRKEVLVDGKKHLDLTRVVKKGEKVIFGATYVESNSKWKLKQAFHIKPEGTNFQTEEEFVNLVEAFKSLDSQCDCMKHISQIAANKAIFSKWASLHPNEVVQFFYQINQDNLTHLVKSLTLTVIIESVFNHLNSGHT